MGARRKFEFTLTFSEEVSQRFPLTEEAQDPDAKPGSWENLPPEIVEIIRKQMGG